MLKEVFDLPVLSEFQAKYLGSIAKSCTPFTILLLKVVSFPNY